MIIVLVAPQYSFSRQFLSYFFSFTIFFASFQIIISVMVTVMMPPAADMTMPIPTQKLVELICSLPVNALVVPLSYNILLVFLSTVYGYKTRSLPDNFNESKHIFLSACATLFLWIAFLPTYFTSYQAVHKSLLLGLSLLLNGSVCMLCLFVPRVYAVYLVNESDLVIGGGGTVSATGAQSTHRRGVNKVAPQDTSTTTGAPPSGSQSKEASDVRSLTKIDEQLEPVTD